MWKNHVIIGASFGAVINPLCIPTAILGATAPDWIEWIIKPFYPVQHRTITHIVVYWIALIMFFYFVWDWRHLGLGFAVGGFSHVIGDAFTIAGVPFHPWSSERFHLFGGKLRTGNGGETIVTGIIAVCCVSFVMYSPVKIGTNAMNESGFIPFFYDWKGEYEAGLIDGREWKDNRLKFF